MIEDSPGSFLLELYSSTLEPQFTKSTIRSSHFALISLDGVDVARTPPSPALSGEVDWGVAYTHRHWQGICAGVASKIAPPRSLAISVWTKNRVKKNFLIGSVTIPLSGEDLGELEHVEFAITKTGQRVGTVILSLTLPEFCLSPKGATSDEPDLPPTPTSPPPAVAGGKSKMLKRSDSGLSHASHASKKSASSRASSQRSQKSKASKASTLTIGMEMDHLMAIIEHRHVFNQSWPSAVVSLAEPQENFEKENAGLVKKMAEEAPTAPAMEEDTGFKDGASNMRRDRAVFVFISPTRGDRSRAPRDFDGAEDDSFDMATISHGALLGTWKCISTNGLEEFLSHTGVTAFQTNIAVAARWPSWEYSHSGATDSVCFVNHSSVGSFEEAIPLDGKEYQHTDGHGNALASRTTWKSTQSGGILITTRSGPMGAYTEERCIVGDQLEFVFRHTESGHSWGRSFVRDADAV